MKGELLKRLGALEARSAPAEEMIVFRLYVQAGQNGAEECEPIGATDDKGWSIARRHDESVQAFRLRAKAEAPANPWGVKVIHEVIAEE